MVRRIGFGDGTGTDTGPVSREGPSENPPKSAPPGKAGKNRPRTTVAGRPRWGAIVFMVMFLMPWMFMLFFVVAGMLKRAGDGVPAMHLVWVALSVLGTSLILRKIRHLFRGGSWLQTPEDAARKATGGDG